MRRTADLLHRLLLDRPEYRIVWRRHTYRDPAAGISVAGVARVIAEYLWDSGERADTETSLARDLKDRVARGLSGTVLTAETLRWFVEAFSLAEVDAQRLWLAYSGMESDGVVDSLARPRRLVVPQRHQTIAVFEHHLVGIDAHSAEHETVHVIAARDAPVDSYFFVPHSDDAEVVVGRGGSLGREVAFGEGLTGREIVLSRTIQPGESTSLRYASRFPARMTPRCEYRRFAHRRSENVDITVTFHESQLPSRVWWTVWDDYRDGRILSQEPVTLDADHSVHRFIARVEQAVVGFAWAF